MRNPDWTKEQLTLLAWTLKFARVDYHVLASLLSKVGPRREAQGVRAKRENLRHIMLSDGHSGLSHGSCLEPWVMSLRAFNRERFERVCKVLAGKDLPAWESAFLLWREF